MAILPRIVVVLCLFVAAVAFSVTSLVGLFSNPSMNVNQKEVLCGLGSSEKKERLGVIFNMALSLLCD